MSPANSVRRRPGGRPAKFNEPSRPVTVTLPDRILDRLRHIDSDRARAIVKVVDTLLPGDKQAEIAVEVVETAPGAGLLVVPPNRSLVAIPWLKMIEVAPTRYLLTIEPGTAIEKVEVALSDLIDHARSDLPHEVPMLETLLSKFTEMRRRQRITKSEILIVSTES